LNISYISLTSTSEEHPDDKHLQASHADHHSAFQQAEVEHSLLRAPHRAEVPVLTCAEIFLLAGEGGDLTRHAEDGLLDAAELFGRGAGFLREVCARLVFDLWVCLVRGCVGQIFQWISYRDLKVDKLVCESRNGIVEAEAVLARVSSREDVVTLALFLAIQNHLLLARLLRRSSDGVVNCRMYQPLYPIAYLCSTQPTVK
jgi:hypothetical protein